MDAKEAAKVLRRHNEWRRGADNNHWQKPPYSQAELGHALDAAVAALEWLEKLKDPGVVLVNMMRGHIANPHAETAARCDALAAENDRMRERLEGMASAKTVAWMTERQQPPCRCDTITQRASELIGLHMSEQEGMIQPTAQQFQDAIDALAQAIGAADQQPRERDLAQDAMK